PLADRSLRPPGAVPSLMRGVSKSQSNAVRRTDRPVGTDRLRSRLVTRRHLPARRSAARTAPGKGSLRQPQNSAPFIGLNTKRPASAAPPIREPPAAFAVLSFRGTERARP